MLVLLLGLVQAAGLCLTFVVLMKELPYNDVTMLTDDVTRTTQQQRVWRVWGAVLLTQIPVLLSLILLDRKVRANLS